VSAIIDQFSSRQLHACWRELLSTCNRTQKLALIEAITYAQHYSSTVLQALSECELSHLFGIPWNTWMYGSVNPKRCA
jgi:hypothetical protein